MRADEGRRAGVTGMRETFLPLARSNPRHRLCKPTMTKEISVFVDESGSFAPARTDLHSPYYLLCMVFHDQTDDLANEIERLREAFRQSGLDADISVHAGPMIRREEEYR